MKAKFEKILLPIADVLVAEDQRDHVTFDAFFANTMFHEVAHGLGIKKTLDGSGTVREALQDQASALAEGQADVLGLYMVTSLFDKGERVADSLEDHYTTFMASIFRYPFRRLQRPRPREHDPLQLLPRDGCVRARRTDGALQR